MILRAAHDGKVGRSLTGGAQRAIPVRTETGTGSLNPSRDEQVLKLRNAGMSARQIAYITGVPRATIGDIFKRHHSSRPEPMPFYKLVDY